MTPTKLLIGQILIVFAIVLAGLWAATQWAAAMLAYQPELGRPWAMIDGLPIYRPWALFVWWYHFDAYARPVFDKAGMLAGASGFFGCAAAVAGSLWRARQANNVTTYGSARWANAREIERAGLHADAGIMDVDRLMFDYAITGDKPAWRPIRAFDDGRQTFIEFPATLAVGEAPPLFLVDRKGDAQLVNYRLRGRFYVVDRLFDAAELRLGTKNQDVVRISRGTTKKSRRAA